MYVLAERVSTCWVLRYTCYTGKYRSKWRDGFDLILVIDRLPGLTSNELKLPRSIGTRQPQPVPRQNQLRKSPIELA
jgi:hypothetical protein